MVTTSSLEATFRAMRQRNRLPPVPVVQAEHRHEAAAANDGR
jgi:hypothetical protein